jgi:serine/threonine protein kinase
MTGSPSAPPAQPLIPSPGDRLDSWKEIAAYFNRDKRTVQRWERNEGMPVHRHQHDKQGTVYAVRAELDEWWKGRRARIEQEEQAERSNVLHWPISADAIRTPVPPEIATRYEVLGELGSGGMGVVYKARDRETREIVALKVLRAELASDPVWMERFKEELRLARKITHKNVCRIHEFVRAKDCAYISMEFVEGDSLRQILNRFGSLNARTCVTITRQICLGLQEAHLQQVIHRDLKPENVMLDRSGQIKLMDFGIACSSQTDDQQEARVLGTPAYMAPEQAEGNAADVRSDIYAVGLILYEMITGRPAFSGETPHEVALKQASEAPTAPRSLEPGIPEQIERAILRALQKSPAERFQTAEEFAQALSSELATPTALEPTQTEELLQPVQATHWQRFDWVLLAAGIAGAILFFVLSGRVLPYGIYRLELSRSGAVARAESLVRAYAPELRHGAYVARFDAGLQLLGLPQLAARTGTNQTLEQARLHARSWGVSLSHSGRPEDAFSQGSSRFDFDTHGALTLLRFVHETSNPDTPPASLDAVKLRAAKFAEELFDLALDSSNAQDLHYDSQTATWARAGKEKLSSPENGAIPVEWTWRDSSGREEGARIWLSGDRLAAAERIRAGEELPLIEEIEHPRLYEFFSNAGTGIVFLGLAVITFARRLFLRRSPAVIVAATVIGVAVIAALAVAHRPDGPALNGINGPTYISRLGWPGALFVCLMFGTVSYFLLSTPYHLTKEVSPERLSSFDALARGEYGSRRIGLACLRGILVGGAILGLYAFCLNFLGRHGITAFSMPVADMLTGSATVALLNAFVRCLAAPILDTWISVMAPFAVVYRFTKKSWLAVSASGAFAFFTANGLDGLDMVPTGASFLSVVLQMLLLAAAFWLTDLLTCMVAVFTIETFLLTFTVMQIFGQTEPWVLRWGLVPWILVALGGIILWCKPQLHAGFRRVTAAFG